MTTTMTPPVARSTGPTAESSVICARCGHEELRLRLTLADVWPFHCGERMGLFTSD